MKKDKWLVLVNFILILFLAVILHLKLKDMAKFKIDVATRVHNIESGFNTLTGRESATIKGYVNGLESFGSRFEYVESKVNDFYTELLKTGFFRKKILYARFPTRTEGLHDSTISLLNNNESPYLSEKESLSLLRTGESEDRILIQFTDIVEDIPENASILGVRLFLFVKERYQFFTGDDFVYLDVYPILNSWSANNQDLPVNWFETGEPNKSWHQPGLLGGSNLDAGNEIVSRSRLAKLLNKDNQISFYLNLEGLEQVQKLISDEGFLRGWVITLNKSGFGPVSFHSSESPDISKHPYLEIFYTLPDES